MVGDFYAATLLQGVVVEVDIGAFVEAVMRWPVRRRGEVVMHVCESTPNVRVAHRGKRVEGSPLLKASRAALRPVVGAL